MQQTSTVDYMIVNLFVFARSSAVIFRFLQSHLVHKTRERKKNQIIVSGRFTRGKVFLVWCLSMSTSTLHIILLMIRRNEVIAFLSSFYFHSSDCFLFFSCYCVESMLSAQKKCVQWLCDVCTCATSDDHPSTNSNDKLWRVEKVDFRFWLFSFCFRLLFIVLFCLACASCVQNWRTACWKAIDLIHTDFTWRKYRCSAKMRVHKRINSETKMTPTKKWNYFSLEFL